MTASSPSAHPSPDSPIPRRLSSAIPSGYSNRGDLPRDSDGLRKDKGEYYTADSVRGNPLRLDDAISTAMYARDESERVMAEVLAGVERSFQPNDDKRLVCRAYVVQLGRTGGRLREATHRLEVEAADALRIAHNENAALLSKLNHLQSQSDHSSKVLASEVERSEAERSAHGDHMHREFERLRREREEECGRLQAEVARLSAALDTSRMETQALWSQAQQQQRVLTTDNEALRTQVAQLTMDLEASRDAHGIDGTTLRAELTLLQAEKTAATNRLRADLAYMTQLASETQAKLEAELVMAKVDKEQTVDALRAEMKQMMIRHDAESNNLTDALNEANTSKEASEMDLRGLLRRERFQHDEEAGRLKGQVKRLTEVQKQAMEAGTLRARQILFWDTVKAGHPTNKGDPDAPSLTWRRADEALPPATARPGSPERHTDARADSPTTTHSLGEGEPGGTSVVAESPN